ncbi:MAG: hypothetical protein ACI3ZP_07775, partial [Candidatus Cryptobacteroides sp.]
LWSLFQLFWWWNFAVLFTLYPLSEDNYLIQLNKFVNGMLWFRCLETREFIGLENTITLLDEFIINNGLVQDFKKFLDEISGQKFEFADPAKGSDEQAN